MNSVTVNLAERSYDIVHANLGDLGPCTQKWCAGKTAFVVTDVGAERHAEAVVESLQRESFETHLTVLPSGEEQKCLASASQLYDRLVGTHADRKTVVVAVGGGVMGDLAGFVAATFNRGLSLVMVPTTLLAMVDSSVGGKVGVNHPRGKNLIGAFHQPRGVLIDVRTLDTLPTREFRSGLAEVVKYGVILDAEFFAYLERHADAILSRKPDVLEHIISRSCRLKADVVQKDEREETGLRVVLNYGHTFAHAFETAFGYGTWLHGEAVAAGMICASRLAERRGLIPADVTRRQCELLHRFSLPVNVPSDSAPAHLLELMRGDKKSSAGKLRFILPTRMGAVELFHDISDADIVAVLAEAMSNRE